MNNKILDISELEKNLNQIPIDNKSYMSDYLYQETKILSTLKLTSKILSKINEDENAIFIGESLIKIKLFGDILANFDLIEKKNTDYIAMSRLGKIIRINDSPEDYIVSQTLDDETEDLLKYFHNENIFKDIVKSGKSDDIKIKVKKLLNIFSTFFDMQKRELYNFKFDDEINIVNFIRSIREWNLENIKQNFKKVKKEIGKILHNLKVNKKIIKDIYFYCNSIYNKRDMVYTPSMKKFFYDNKLDPFSIIKYKSENNAKVVLLDRVESGNSILGFFTTMLEILKEDSKNYSEDLNKLINSFNLVFIDFFNDIRIEKFEDENYINYTYNKDYMMIIFKFYFMEFYNINNFNEQIRSFMQIKRDSIYEEILFDISMVPEHDFIDRCLTTRSIISKPIKDYQTNEVDEQIVQCNVTQLEMFNYIQENLEEVKTSLEEPLESINEYNRYYIKYNHIY